VSDYGRSKQLAEEEVRRVAHRLPVTVVRPANVLGPRQRELWQAIRLIRRGIVPVVGTPRTRTSIVGVEDLVRALLVAAQHARAIGQTYLVAHRQPHSWQEIATAIGQALGTRPARVKIPYAAQYALAAAAELAAWALRATPPLRRDHLQATRRYCWLYDASKIDAELGVRATMDLPAILGATVAWYRDQGLL
jgi:dihydroflavonol-4-reductase